MTTKLIDGRKISAEILSEVRSGVEKFREESKRPPGLAVVRVGEDPASAVYVRNKVKTASELGIFSEHIHLPAETEQAQLKRALEHLNERQDIDAILLQLPLPKQIDADRMLEIILPEKDVDGFHPVNVGRLWQNQEASKACTPAGIIEILKSCGVKIAGANAVVVGRSNIVGRPVAAMLLNNDATVTICHSKTPDIAEITKKADILISAVGKPGFIRGSFIRPGAVVIDVGINRITQREILIEMFDGDELERRFALLEKQGSVIVGDVNFREALGRAEYLTPVPGGVGPLTISMLMKNTLMLANRRINELKLISHSGVIA
jgi:methylenetetrahydrofolate dehydrogenase (NADP+)/methenyltetrahydrofolate cyclohydrolase